MSIKVKTKIYGPALIHCDQAGELSFASSQEQPATLTPPLSSPAELLLYATGACIAKSILIAAKSKKISINPFTVVVDGESAEDLPIRVGTFNIQVGASFTATAEQSLLVLKAAKAMCTVSNTLNAKVNLGLN